MNKEELKNKYFEYGLSNYWNEQKGNLKNSIKIVVKGCTDNELNIGSSKFGGLPDLPKNIDWFVNNDMPMSFIAQINFEEVKKYDINNKLPQNGILYLFYDSIEQPWGYQPEDKKGKKVFFYKGNATELERKQKPELLDANLFFNPAQLIYENGIEAPDYFSRLMNYELSNEELDDYWKLEDNLYSGPQNKILGHSNNLQGSMELECELVANGLNYGDLTKYEDSLVKELKKNISQWQLLLQIDSNEKENNMMWGDGGKIYLWIKEQDLKDENFENSWLILQCS